MTGLAPWPEEVLRARVRFWVCPRGHSSTGPLRPTVEWRDGVAHCLTPTCPHTSAQCLVPMPDEPESDLAWKHFCTLPAGHPVPTTVDMDGETVDVDHATPERGAAWSAHAPADPVATLFETYREAQSRFRAASEVIDDVVAQALRDHGPAPCGHAGWSFAHVDFDSDEPVIVAEHDCFFMHRYDLHTDYRAAIPVGTVTLPSEVQTAVRDVLAAIERSRP